MKKICLALLLIFPLLSVSAQTDVLTQHNDNSRTGQNTKETILTPTNVNSTTFGKLFSASVDGFVYAQPLYKSNLTIAGASHNVVFVATEGDSVYAFDADSGATLWHASLIDSAHGGTQGETTENIQNDLNDQACTDLIPQVGVTSTPVIDPGTGTLYVEAKSHTTNGPVHRLHFLDITSGAEKSGSPIKIVPTFTNGSGTTITFDPLRELNRPGLLLANGNVYIGYGSHCDKTPYYGWLVAYSASIPASQTPTAVFVTTPNITNTTTDGQGAIWQSGAGLAADSMGNIFVATGNGDFPGTSSIPAQQKPDVGDSIIKLSSSLTLSDYFTPFDQHNDDINDYDVGSGGVLLVPDPQPGAHPNVLIQAGKPGNIYLIDRDQMTTNNLHYCSNCSSDPEIVQEVHAGTVPWLFAVPAYWNHTVYYWGCGQGLSDVLKAYSLSNGLLGTSPSSVSGTVFAFPCATPAISANGNTNGIVWAIDSSQFGPPAETVAGPAVLHAYDATNVAIELYNSAQAGARDQAGKAVKFTVPTIFNGKVYIGTQTELDVYGLLPTPAARPSISPISGTESSPVTVTITDATPGATITYTTDGSTPAPGTHGTAIASGGSFSVSVPSTVKAIASASGFSNSAIATAIYTTQSGGGTPSYGSGFTSAAGLSLNNGAALSGTKLRITDGGTGETRSVFFTTPVNIQSFSNTITFQDTNASADGSCFVIQAAGPTALGLGGGDLGYAGTTGPLSSNSLCIAFDLYNSSTRAEISNTGLFTDGASPAHGAGSPAGSLSFQSGHVMSVQMNYDGTTLTLQITDTVTKATFSTSFPINIPQVMGGSNTAYVGFTGASGGLTAVQDILTWTFTPGSSQPQAATPSISPASGTQSSPVTVTLTDTTSGATITYTTDGSTPAPGTHGTAIASGGSFSVSVPSTVKAIASASGFSNSAVATAIYTSQSGGTPSYGSGFTSAAGLSLNNGAALNGTRLRLTDGGTGETRSVFFTTPVNLGSFTNVFTFQDTNASADGFCFVIQAAGPTALGLGGGALGYADTTGPLSTNSLCIAFDLYNSSTRAEISNTGLFTDGASPAHGAGSPAGSLSFQSDHVMSVQMNYDGTTLTLQITDTITQATFSTSFPINIPATVGSNTAYVGFTGADGGLTSIQDILTWTFQ